MSGASTSELNTEWYPSPPSSLRTSQPTRPVIAALHGFFGSPADWKTVLEPFATTHDLCLITLPGHGRHEVRSQLYTFGGIAYEIAHILSAYDPAQRVILGYSLGGRIASYAVLTEQLKAAGIGILSGHLGLESSEKRWERLLSDDLAAFRLLHQPLGEILEEWYALPLFAHELSDAEAKSAFIQRRSDHDPSALARSLTGFSLGWQPDLRGLIQSHAGKLLYLAGGKDEVYRKLAQEVFALHPGRRARILPESGHDLLGAASRNPAVMTLLQSEIADFLAEIGKEKK